MAEEAAGVTPYHESDGQPASAICICGHLEATNAECERCELLRMGGVLARLAVRLGDRLEQLGEQVALTSEEVGALFGLPAEDAEQVLQDNGIESVGGALETQQ